MSRGKFLPTRRRRAVRPSRRVPLLAEALGGRPLLSTVAAPFFVGHGNAMRV
jgi:hypothetical protein